MYVVFICWLAESLVAFVALAALPVQDPELPDTFPVIDAFIVEGSFNVIASDPSKSTPVLVFVPSSVIFKDLAVLSFVAVPAFPDTLPVTSPVRFPENVAAIVEGNLIEVAANPSKFTPVLV